MNLEAVRNFRFEAVSHTYSCKDTILYALGLGYGANPADPSQLAFVYEDNLRTVPSICCVLAHPGMWVRNPALGIDWLKMLHGEQSFEIHNPIPPEGTVVGSYALSRSRTGRGEGAILHQIKPNDRASGRCRDRSQRAVHARRWRVRRFWRGSRACPAAARASARFDL